MPENPQPYCPECEPPVNVDRRAFLRAVGGQAAILAVAGGAAPALAREDKAKAAARAAKPAEELIRELYSTLSAEQKAQIALPWDHRTGGNLTRLGMYNAAIGGKTIEKHYTKPQQELIGRILRSICSDEQGYQCITRNGTFDNSKSLENCGVTLFGDPSGNNKFAWVFTGHHLTVRCDGNSEPGAAFGGPMYYGHSPNGYSDKNVFYYQTKQVLNVFDALNEAQRKKAVVKGSPGEHAASVRFRPRQERPGIPCAELTRDQREYVEQVMRAILSPYRKEDADEVMQIVKAQGGIEQIQLAFYEDAQMNDKQPWHFWRLEGPGFVWNYRVLPHVHTYVNISSQGA